MLRIPIIVILVFFYNLSYSQTCINPGQTPISAIYVCGTESFTHSTQQFCGTTNVPVSCPGNFAYLNKNPTYFRFACYSSGTLGFIITPGDLSADLNWQLFDITSTNPVDIFTNPALFVGCNWSSEPGPTGASDDGTQYIVCGGPGGNTFSRMPNIVAGRSYILMLSNESGDTGPFNLLFTGGTGSITDAEDPHLRDASTNCDRMQVRVRMNKSLLCNSIALNGSDFSIAGVNVIGALPFDCSSVFGTDLIILTLDQPLPVGTHSLVLGTGTDGNTLVDICNRSIPVGETLSLVAGNAAPTPMDSISFEPCAPGYIELVFSKPMNCASFATDGSDFVITGPQTLVPAIGCLGGTNKTFRLILPPNYLPGNYQVQLTTGTDGNTITDECGIETPAGAILNFRLARGVSAAFTQSGNLTCGQSEIQFQHSGQNGVNSWLWNFGAAGTSIQQNPLVNFQTGNYSVSLIVSNGDCSDTSVLPLTISNELAANFEIPNSICEGDTLSIRNTSVGNVDEWSWDFGNGNTSSLRDPPAPIFTTAGREAYYSIRLVATINASSCSDTLKKILRVIPNCSLDVPTAFTPNGDGKNDFFYPVNALRARDMKFRVYNRFGQVLFNSNNWSSKWDGRVKGEMQETGVYAWIFEYTNESGIRVLKKGTVLLIR